MEKTVLFLRQVAVGLSIIFCRVFLSSGGDRSIDFPQVCSVWGTRHVSCSFLLRSSQNADANQEGETSRQYSLSSLGLSHSVNDRKAVLVQAR